MELYRTTEVSISQKSLASKSCTNSNIKIYKFKERRRYNEKIRILVIIVLLFFILQTTVCAEGYYVRTCIIDAVITTIYYLSGIPEDVENYTCITREELDKVVQSESNETIKTFDTNTRSETTSDVTELIECDITYNITSGENISVNVLYNLYNSNTADESITVY